MSDSSTSHSAFGGTGTGNLALVSLPVNDLPGAGSRGGVSPEPPALYENTHREAGGVTGGEAPVSGTPHIASGHQLKSCYKPQLVEHLI